jgi:nitrile hydratase
MNGVHDMGGMQGYGPVIVEENEPLFHHAWESRALAIVLAMGAAGKWNIDWSRSVRESIPPALYLSVSYYQIWFEGLERLLMQAGLVEPQEIHSAKALVPPGEGVRKLLKENVAAILNKGGPTERETHTSAQFSVGQTVRTRQMNPSTHTRLPHYCRDKLGVVTAIHGAHVYPDTNALRQGEQPQWLYTVSFDAHALWGPDTTASSVRVDCWEPYLMAVEL